MDVRKQMRVPDEERQTMRFEPMRREEENITDGFGRLPACAPLANPFVPFQPDNPVTYPAKKGIVRGTMYPGLDLPFMGMVNNEPLPDTPLAELQTLCFAVVELGMYLDTHQDDEEAFQLFRKYAEMYQRATAAYEKECGPLTQQADAMGKKYTWMKDPWPWDAPMKQMPDHDDRCEEG